MDVIAHNIANVNTIGYKSSRATFMDAFYQRLQGASGPNPDTGRAGTNPLQIGLGVNLGSIDNIMTQGASQRTDNAFDAMIQGSGFFIVSDNTGTYFTRAGNIKVDSQYNLHINGMRLMGWDAVWSPEKGEYIIEKAPVKPLDLAGDKQYMPPRATTILELVGNLNPNELPPTGVVERTIALYDSDGTLFTVDMEFRYVDTRSGDNVVVDGGNEIGTLGSPDFNNSVWIYTMKTDSAGNVYAYANGDRDNKFQISVLFPEMVSSGGGGGFDGALYDDLTHGYVVFDNTGSLYSFGSVLEYGPIATGTEYVLQPNSYNRSTGPVFDVCFKPLEPLNPKAYFGDLINKNQPITEPGYNPGINETNGLYTPDRDTLDFYEAKAGIVKFDFTQFTGFDGEHITAKIFYKDGNAPGTLSDYAIGPDGTITGRYSNGVTRPLGQIPVAQFRNPAGLEKVGSNLFAVTNNSGQFDGVGDVGDILGGALEMSNVDLSQEFTEMITTQRGFQANSRVITVSDDMLAELVNLKR
ncbi:MAG: flagellar hook-basal body complex protein [Defluviitaleaceae bacterium]|nr:flagellar hook-basal body complex protein [Defluviitaleaceae bacterium]